VTDNQNSLTVSQRGPVLLQDVHLIEKLATLTVSVSRSASFTPWAPAPMATSRCTKAWRNTPKPASFKTRQSRRRSLSASPS